MWQAAFRNGHSPFVLRISAKTYAVRSTALVEAKTRRINNAGCMWVNPRH